METGTSTASDNCHDCRFKSSLFRFLTSAELELIRENKITVTFRKGETIRKQGTFMTHVLSLNSGFAKLYIEGNGNRNAILRIVKPTNFIGGPALFLDRLHHFTLAALTESRICFIDIQVFKQVMEANREFSFGLIKEFDSHMLSVYKRLLNVTQKKVPGRMADTLIYLLEEIYNQTPFPMDLSKQDLAELSGMSKESTIKVLREFHREGIIRMDGKSMNILDMDQLKKISRIG